MTVPASSRRAGPFSGNGVATAFPFTFLVFSAADIEVVLADADGVETVLTLSSDYTVTLNPDQNASPGGTVTYPISGAAMPALSTLTVVGSLDYEQTLDLPGGGNFSPTAIENALDRGVIQTQQLLEVLDRTLRLPVSAEASAQLPVPAAGNFIGWDETGAALRNVDPSTAASIVAYANRRTLVADGGLASYTLAADPGNVNNTVVAVGGVLQTPGVDYTLSGVTLTPTTSWPAGTGNVSINYGEALPIGTAVASGVSFVQSGAGAATQNLETRNRRVVYVTDWATLYNGVVDETTAVQQAISSAIARGADLYWPDGAALVTANLVGLHSVRNIGPGRIIRGADTFRVSPNDGQTNTLYVATTGSASNDGLTAALPLNTLQAAFDALATYFPLNGEWVIQLAAGTYSSAAQRTARLGPANTDYATDGVLMRNMLTIKGPDVGYIPTSAPTPTPTAVFDGGGAAVIGIQLEVGLKVRIRDIRFLNYNGSASSAGVSVDDCWVLTENVHADNCTFGINALNHSRLEQKGGTINNCSAAGTQCLFLTKHEIGNQSAGAAGQGPFFTNCAVGFRSQECSTGHTDFASFTSCGTGVEAQVNSRVNLNGTDFKLCQVAVRCDNGSNVFPTGVAFNTGTGNANTENIRIGTGSSIAGENAPQWRTLDRQATTYNTLANTSEQTAFTFTLAADRFTSVPSSIYRGKAVRVRVIGSKTGTAGTLALRIRIGGTLTVGVTAEADANGSFEYETTIYLTASATQKSVGKVLFGIGTNRTKVGYAASTISTASSSALSVTATVQLGSAADSAACELAEIEVQG